MLPAPLIPLMMVAPMKVRSAIARLIPIPMEIIGAKVPIQLFVLVKMSLVGMTSGTGVCAKVGTTARTKRAANKRNCTTDLERKAPLIRANMR